MSLQSGSSHQANLDHRNLHSLCVLLWGWVWWLQAFVTDLKGFCFCFGFVCFL